MCDNDYWTISGYNDVCGAITVGGACSSSSCDVANNYYCNGESSWVCYNPSVDCHGCEEFDADCQASCTNGFCDVEADSYCSDSSWTNISYKNNCVGKDYEFGCTVCLEITCDYYKNKVSNNGQWTE